VPGQSRAGAPVSLSHRRLAVPLPMMGRSLSLIRELRNSTGLIPVLVEAAPTHYHPRNAEACDKAERNGQFQINGEVAGHGRTWGFFEWVLINNGAVVG